MKKIKWSSFFNWGYFFGILAVLILLNVIGALINVKIDMVIIKFINS